MSVGTQRCFTDHSDATQSIPEAHENLSEEEIKEYLKGGEHDCPHFKDDMLPR